MASPRIVSSGFASGANLLKMPKIPMDAYVDLFGGDFAIIDPLQSGITGDLSSGASVPNIVLNGAAAAVSTGTFAAVGANKGLLLTNGAAERLNLPLVFNLATLGTTPSAVISAWITLKGSIPSGQNSIMGCAYQTNDYCQWAISTVSETSKLRISLVGNVSIDIDPPSFDVPHLISLYFKKSGPSAYDVMVYVDGALAGSRSGLLYPFVNPQAGFAASVTPRIGTLAGFPGDSATAVVARARIRQVDPGSFAIAAFNTAELTANAAARFG